MYSNHTNDHFMMKIGLDFGVGLESASCVWVRKIINLGLRN